MWCVVFIQEMLSWQCPEQLKQQQINAVQWKVDDDDGDIWVVGMLIECSALLVEEEQDNVFRLMVIKNT